MEGLNVFTDIFYLKSNAPYMELVRLVFLLFFCFVFRSKDPPRLFLLFALKDVIFKVYYFIFPSFKTVICIIKSTREMQEYKNSLWLIYSGPTRSQLSLV